MSAGVDKTDSSSHQLSYNATFDPAAYDNTFIADLVDFVAADSFQTLFEAFFLKYAIEFTDEPEHKFMYTTIYEKFGTILRLEFWILLSSLKVHAKSTLSLPYRKLQ